MDPLSIAGFATASAASCLQLSTRLFTYIEEVRDVDSIVSALGSDLQLLAASLDGISTTLKEHGSSIVAKLNKSAKLFKSLSLCIIECDETLNEVEGLLDDAQKHGWLARKMPRVATHFSLSQKMKELELLRGRVTSFHTAINMNLDMINVCLILQTHDRMTSQEDALTGIRNLEGRMEELFKRLNLDDADSYTPSQLLTFRQCLHSAQSVRYTASTILDDGESMAVPTESGVGSNSILGTSSAIQKVTLWLSSSELDVRDINTRGDLEAIPESTSSNMTPLSVSKSGDQPSSPLATESTIHEIRDSTEVVDLGPREIKQPNKKPEHDQGTDKEDVSGPILHASNLFEQGSYGEAENVLTAILKRVRRNSSTRSWKYQALAMLGKCYLEQGKLSLAEDTLLPLCASTMELNSSTISARLNMAKVLYKTGRAQPAQRWARKAASIAEFIFSNNHPLYEESVEYLAMLHDHLGASEGAQAARGLLSVKEREAMSDEFMSLLTKKGLVPAAQYVVGWISKFYGQAFMKTSENVWTGLSCDAWKDRIKTIMDFKLDESDLLALVAIAGHGPWVQLVLSRGGVAAKHHLVSYWSAANSSYDNGAYNAIHFALELENYTVCRMLLDTTPEFKVCKFMSRAAMSKNWFMVNLLISHHSRCTDRSDHSDLNDTLRETTKQDIVHLINPLISIGASLEAVIFDIISQNKMHILKELVKECDLNFQADKYDLRGCTPLTYAIAHNRFDMMVLMLDAGANIQLPFRPWCYIGWRRWEHASETPLFVAVKNSRHSMVEELLKRGADPNSPATILVKGRLRTTYALHRAVENTYLEGVDILLATGAAVNMLDASGKTALDIAGQVALDSPELSEDLLEIISLLRSKGGTMSTWTRLKLRGLQSSSWASIRSALESG